MEKLFNEIFKPLIKDAIREVLKECSIYKEKVKQSEIDYMNADEAANFLRKSKSTIYRYSHLGTIPTHGIGEIYFLKEDLEKFRALKRKKSIDEGIDILLTKRKESKR